MSALSLLSPPSEIILSSTFSRELIRDQFENTRKDEKGNPKIAVLLNDSANSETTDSKGKRPANDGVPTEYRLTMQNTASKNMYVFGERIEDDEETGEEGARKKRRELFLITRFNSLLGPRPLLLYRVILMYTLSRDI